MLDALAPLAPGLVAVAAVALAGTTLAAAGLEIPPGVRMPRLAVVMAAAWAALFLGAAVLEADRNLVVTGLLVAAAELAGAAALWLARGRTRPDDDDHRGGGDHAPPPPRTLPDEYWRRWEEQFEPQLCGPSRR